MDVLIYVPQHHEVPNVLLAVEFALGEANGSLVLVDLLVKRYGSCPENRAGGLGQVDLELGVVGGHGGW